MQNNFNHMFWATPQDQNHLQKRWKVILSHTLEKWAVCWKGGELLCCLCIYLLEAWESNYSATHSASDPRPPVGHLACKVHIHLLLGSSWDEKTLSFSEETWPYFTEHSMVQTWTVPNFTSSPQNWSLAQSPMDVVMVYVRTLIMFPATCWNVFCALQ